jgi:hypothetical protein
MAIDYKKLTDEELAFLLYAAEEEEESVGFYRYTTTEYCCAGLKIKKQLEKEYDRRGLHQDLFLSPEYYDSEE